MKRASILLLIMTLTGCQTTRCGMYFRGCNFLKRSCSGESCTQTQACPTADSRSARPEGILLKPKSCCLGCETLVIKRSAKSLAHKYMPKHACGPDFKNGFEQAFVDVAMGASGEVPALAPRHYWDQAHRTNEGHAEAQAWFEGYRSGSQIACSMTDRNLDVAAAGPDGTAWGQTYGTPASY